MFDKNNIKGLFNDIGDAPMVQFLKSWIQNGLHHSLEDVFSLDIHCEMLPDGLTEEGLWKKFKPGEYYTFSLWFTDKTSAYLRVHKNEVSGTLLEVAC